MEQLPISITIVIAVLAVFLIFVAAIRYTVADNFLRARMLMTSFFFFIVITLSVSFWDYAFSALPYTIPAVLLGMLLGYVLGVRTERQKLEAQGLAHYMEHFAHIHASDLESLTWWSIINFYSVMGGLLLVNLVGLTNVIFRGAETWAIATNAVGAFLLGTILPYLGHLWTIRTTQKSTSTTREP